MSGGALAGLSGLLLVAGLLLAIEGAMLRDRPHHRRQPHSSSRLQRWWREASPRHRGLVLGSFAGGVAAWAISGWPLAIAVVPAAVLGVPWLLATPSNRDVELLTALDRWVRSLSASIPTGKSIRDSIRANRTQTPSLLVEPVNRLLARLDDRWSVREAFWAMADEIDSPDADSVVAALALASERGGVGASTTLTALSDTIQERLKAMREISTERAKPRVIVRQVTMISLTVLAGAFVLGASFFEPYGTPLGQVVLLALGLAYVGSLVMLRRLTLPPRRERVLIRRGGARV